VECSPAPCFQPDGACASKAWVACRWGEVMLAGRGELTISRLDAGAPPAGFPLGRTPRPACSAAPARQAAGLYCVYSAFGRLAVGRRHGVQYLHPTFTALLAWPLLGLSGPERSGAAGSSAGLAGGWCCWPDPALAWAPAFRRHEAGGRCCAADRPGRRPVLRPCFLRECAAAWARSEHPAG